VTFDRLIALHGQSVAPQRVTLMALFLMIAAIVCRACFSTQDAFGEAHDGSAVGRPKAGRWQLL
jgi:hypothetical protein